MEQEEEEEGRKVLCSLRGSLTRAKREMECAYLPTARPTEGRGEQSQGQRHPPPCASVVRASVRPRCGGAIHSWMDGSGSPLYLMLRGSLLHRNLRPRPRL